MRTLKTIRPAITLIALLFTAQVTRVQAQQSAPANTELLASIPEGAFGTLPSPKEIVRFELVDRTYAPTAYSADALLRIARPLSDGRIEVRVVAAGGDLRMSGFYADGALQIENGPFEYFHPLNGQLESRGEYVEGQKVGTWERYDRSGKRLADRNYLGLTYEQIQLALGQASEACTADLETR